MRILINSRVFRPSVGGIESMMEILAEEFVYAGHEVRVATRSFGEGETSPDYEVVRLPSLRSSVRLLRWSDVCLCANLSLRELLPMIIASTPVVMSHHNTYGSHGQLNVPALLKRGFTRLTNNVCCSRAIQSHISGESIVIPNTYRSEFFKEYGDVSKDLDVVFLGRLVSDKGASDLIQAIDELNRLGMRSQLSIVGDGPERQALLTQVGELGLGTQVKFTGVLQGSELARFLSRHRVMAVPSRCSEGFGVVALEGIACGCVVIGTNLGGLPEAIGSCGITVPILDTSALAREIKVMLEDDSVRARYRSFAQLHLERHSRQRVASAYLDVLKSAVDGVRPSYAWA